jgi:hypothetical protein
MRKRGIFYAVLACVLLSGCQALEKKQQAGAVVELDGQYLYRSTLDSLTLGLAPEDSLRVAQQYIRQWAQDLLVYKEVRSQFSSANADLERMIEDYRRTLYAQAYEERLVNRRMPKGIPDSVVTAVYEQMPNRFVLDESIMQGLLVVVPADAPKVPKLRQWLKDVKGATAEALDKIEKYAYQNASEYVLFTDQWLTATEMTGKMPIDRAELEAKLKTANQIEIADSAQLYILQLTDKHMRGEAMPLDYARPEIEKMVLNARRVEFLRKERERLYNEAIQENKLTFFDTTE